MRGELCGSAPRYAADSLTVRLAEWADDHDGVVSRGEATALGLSRHQLATAMRTARLREIFPGVWAVGHRALRQRGWWRAVVLGAGPGGRLAGDAAGAVHDLRRSDRLEVVVPYGREVVLPGVEVHRTRRLPDAECAIVDGLPVTSVSRTLLDLAGRGRRVRPLLERAEDLQLIDMVALFAVLGRGRRGSAALRREIAEFIPADDARSALERAFTRFVARHGLPAPVLNTLVEGFLVDAAWPEHRLIVELDGWGTHGRRSSFESDRARDAGLLVAGWRVIRLTWARLHAEPAAVAAQLRRLLGEL